MKLRSRSCAVTGGGSTLGAMRGDLFFRGEAAGGAIGLNGLIGVMGVGRETGDIVGGVGL